MARRAYAATASDPRAKVQFTGPIFEPQADATLRQNIRAMLASVADEGDRTLTARSPHKTGAFKEGIVSRNRSARDGRAWALTAVVSATHVYPWGEHVGASISRAESGGRREGRRGENRKDAEYRGGKLERKYGMFRSVTSQLRSARATLASDLTKGLG